MWVDKKEVCFQLSNDIKTTTNNGNVQFQNVEMYSKTTNKKRKRKNNLTSVLFASKFL